MISIYTLSDPRTGNVRYVGKSKNPTARLSSHLLSGASWIKELKSYDLAPVMNIVALVNEADANEKEALWIKHYKSNGHILVNKCHLVEFGVRTIIDIPDALHTQAKTYAAQNGTTLKALVNEGLSELLKRKSPATPKRFRKGERV
jgi:excinuclease UvrABC nuclease subunit